MPISYEAVRAMLVRRSTQYDRAWTVYVEDRIPDGTLCDADKGGYIEVGSDRSKTRQLRAYAWELARVASERGHRVFVSRLPKEVSVAVFERGRQAGSGTAGCVE